MAADRRRRADGRGLIDWPMTAGAPRLPARGTTGHDSDMSKHSDKERGEKRGVLSTGRANDDEDADDAADEEG